MKGTDYRGVWAAARPATAKPLRPPYGLLTGQARPVGTESNNEHLLNASAYTYIINL